MRGLHWLRPAEVWIGCGATKALDAAPAIDLYTGPVFRAHRRLAARFGVPIYVLSARHGLVPAETRLAPYDEGTITPDWGARVARAGNERSGLVFVLAGRRYVEPWRALLRRPVVVGLEGKMLGERLRSGAAWGEDLDF